MDIKITRRLAAIVSADLAGYSRLMGIDEVGTLNTLRRHRQELIDPLISEHGGRIVKTMGDGLLIEFPSVVSAVACSVSVQEGMAKRNEELQEVDQFAFRIGVNLGDILIEDEDIHGDGVNIAARLEALAEPGGICVSERVHDDVRDRIGINFVDLGKRELKNISRTLRCWAWHPARAETQKIKSTSEFLKAPVLVVFPFNNFSSDPEYEFFADGLSEDLTTLLSAYRDFPVIARNSAFMFKGKEFDVTEAGQQLGADYAVEGSVRVAGNRMRVNAQLIDVSSGHHLWAQKFDRNIEDIFTLQDELSLQIAAMISPTVVRHEGARANAATSEDIGHWAAMVRIRQRLLSADAQNISEAIVALLEQERKHPEDSMIQALIAWFNSMEIVSGTKGFREVRAEMVKRSKRALQLDPTNYLAYNMLAIGEQFHGHLDAALQANEKSIELNPSAGLSYAWRATTKCLLGQLEESIEDFAIMERLSPMDPLLPASDVNKSRSLLFLGRFDEAIKIARRSIDGVPNLPYSHVALISALGNAGMAEAAKDHAREFQERFPDIHLSSVFVNFRTRDPKDFELFKNGMKVAGFDID
ncbi:adenylate/guanylate cyclase domain-containing protein [Marimonas sp. MJW-29]|uniref:Adenylate/guanylate cyclase domain-containing protein n=1 Tax=Sulfitobacter sediminis TaxID=3234186 RepID=A0ABV3RSY1_9RHOB